MEEKQKDAQGTIEQNNQRIKDYKEQMSSLKAQAAKYLTYTPRPDNNLILNSVEQFSSIYTDLDEKIKTMTTIEKFKLLKKSIKAFFFRMRNLANSDRRQDHLQMIAFFKDFQEKNAYNNPKISFQNDSF